MTKAIRIAVATAFGVAATLPAFADFDNNGPSDKQGQHLMQSLNETNPPALESGPRVLADNRLTADGRVYQAPDGRVYERSDTRVYSDPYLAERAVPGDRDYVVAENRPPEGRIHRFFHRDHDRAQYRYGAESYSPEPGRMSTWYRSPD